MLPGEDFLQFLPTASTDAVLTEHLAGSMHAELWQRQNKKDARRKLSQRVNSLSLLLVLPSNARVVPCAEGIQHVR